VWDRKHFVYSIGPLFLEKYLSPSIDKRESIVSGRESLGREKELGLSRGENDRYEARSYREGAMAIVSKN